ncbi:Exonuclease SbcC [Raoultella ornithinolytica]|nr:Exonuclease SbcC [Raoultella ornithinolytica]
MNTRLQDRLRLRAGIRLAASRQMTACRMPITPSTCGLTNTIAIASGETAGGLAGRLPAAGERCPQQNVVQQSLAEIARKLAELPPATLTLDADQVTASLAQHAAARPLRQQLSTLHSRLLPLRQRQQQLQTTEQTRREEQEKLETTLAQRRLAYKEKHQQFSDVKAICELEARIVGLEEERARLQPGAPCPLCGSSEHPAVAQYRALEPGVNQARRDSLEREVKQLAEEGAQLRGPA